MSETPRRDETTAAAMSVLTAMSAVTDRPRSLARPRQGSDRESSPQPPPGAPPSLAKESARGRRLASWVEARIRRHWFSMIAGFVFVVVRIGAFVSVAGPVAYYDSGEYRAFEGGPHWPYVSLTGSSIRPPTVPLFYAAFGDDVWRSAAQLVVSVLAWLVLATAMIGGLQRRWLRRVGFVVTLLFGSTLSVTSWDRLILSESLALSLAVLTFAAWIRFARLPDGWFNAAAVVASMLLFTLTRTHFIPFVAMGAIVVGAWAIRRAYPKPRMFAAGGLLLVAVYATVVVRGVEATSAMRSEAVGQFGQNFVMVLQTRILTDAETLRWFRDQGMPEPTGLRPPSPDDGGFRKVLATYAANAPLVEWVERDGASTLLRYSITHPEKLPARFLSESPDIMVSERKTVLYLEMNSVLPDRLEAFLAPTSEDWRFVLPPFVFVYGVVAASTIPRRRRVHRSMFAVAVATFAVSWAAFYLGWLVAPMEAQRHAIPFTSLIPLSLVLMALLVTDSWQPGGTRARSNLTV